MSHDTRKIICATCLNSPAAVPQTQSDRPADSMSKAFDLAVRTNIAGPRAKRMCPQCLADAFEQIDAYMPLAPGIVLCENALGTLYLTVA